MSEELRVACRILKNAGYVPPEVESLREVASLVRLIRGLEPGDARARAVVRLNLLTARLAEGLPGGRLPSQYLDRVLDRLECS